MSWDQDPQVLSPAGRTIGELLQEGPRRQDLPGFEPVYRDFVDYIIRCTHRIWEQKNVGLCRTHYGETCVMHTLAGPASGLDAVVQGTVGALGVYSDRVVVGEDVIWSEESPGVFYSSHRIMSHATHLGDEAMVGAATMRGNGATTIADCLCRDNRIIEEWLVRDNLRAVRQLGVDPWALARAQAQADQAGDPARHAWRSEAIAKVRSEPDAPLPDGHPAALPARALRQAFAEDLYGEASQALSPAAEVRWPTNRHGFGRGYWIGCAIQLRAALHRPALRLEHFAARPLPHGDTAVAIRWSMAGVHLGEGVWGPPTGRDLLIMAVSHYRLRAGLIVQDTTVFDEMAVLRQVVGGLSNSDRLATAK